MVSDAFGSGPGRLRVVVLTCAGLGLETAAALEDVDGIDVVAVMNSPHRPLPLRRKLRKVWRSGGLPGLLRSSLRRMAAAAATLLPRGHRAELPTPRCTVHQVEDFHSEECLAILRDLRPDVAVVDGTYILKPQLFDLPRLGSINLHCGKVPEYRGAPPAFWELYDGTQKVGITVHAVTEKLDEGPILAERAFPLDTAPAGDPVDYVQEFWRNVLRPNGIRMLRETLAALRDGAIQPRPQPASAAATHRFPTYRQVRELRRRVRARRRDGQSAAHPSAGAAHTGTSK